MTPLSIKYGSLPLRLEDIERARNRITPYIRKTPCFSFDYLALQKKKEIYLKLELFQKTGSFKIRGAANFILENMTQAKQKGVVAASAGNHAQGVAAICNALGIKATIVMPIPTPGIKVQNTQRWGAAVELVGDNYDESFAHAMSLSKDKGYLYVHAFQDPLIMAGQGTVALELIEEESFKNTQAIVVPVGGGGLITGIAAAFKVLRPDIKIYGVTAQNAPTTYSSFKKGTVTDQPVFFTLAEGVSGGKTEPYMLNCLKSGVDDIFSLSEESIAHAISLLAEHGKMCVEGAGALPIAAILEDLIPEQNILAVISGGNIDLPALGNVLQRGLVEQGRLVRLVITIIDRPGGLNALTQVLADTRANVLQVFHQRATLHTKVGEAEVEVDIETRGQDHTEKIVSALNEKGFKVRHVS